MQVFDENDAVVTNSCRSLWQRDSGGNQVPRWFRGHGQRAVIAILRSRGVANKALHVPLKAIFRQYPVPALEPDMGMPGFDAFITRNRAESLRRLVL